MVRHDTPLPVNQPPEVLRLHGDSEGLDLHELLSQLSQRGLHDVMVEAGPRLAGAFLNAGLVDEILLYMAPMLLGDLARPLVHMPELVHLEQALNFTLFDVTQLGQDLRLRLRPAQVAGAA